jgi:hypothetical protein
MRLSLILPPVEPAVYPAATACPAGCGGRALQPWQDVPKPVRDTQVDKVVAHRYRCVRCGRTFRVYPVGVSHDQTSARLIGSRRSPPAWPPRPTGRWRRSGGAGASRSRLPRAAAVRALRLMTERQPRPAASATLAAIHGRYQAAASPRQAQPEAMSLAYRLRLFSLDRWNLWGRLTRYRTWAVPTGEVLDGTNNACERAIGWWVTERYRRRRGYQRPQSVLHVSRAPRQPPDRRHGQRPGGSRLRLGRRHSVTDRGRGAANPLRRSTKG